MKPNKYQVEIFRSVKEDSDRISVQARAGTGKTTTIVEALKRLPKGRKRVLLCAFNKHIQRDLEEKVPKKISVRTLHALGLKALNKSMEVTVDKDRTLRLIRQIYPGMKFAAPVKDLIGRAKNLLIDDYEGLLNLAYHLGNQTPVADAKTAHLVMTESLKTPSVIDFDDMLYLPHKLALRPPRFDLIFVDEAQDLNPAQKALVGTALRPGGRLVAVGDDRQAIYGWRGADTTFLLNGGGSIKPLPITYRCPRLVVDQARRVVPEYEAADFAEDGVVDVKRKQEMLETAKAGDFILSRTNAPLLPTCLKLLAMEKPATILGRDVAVRIEQLIRKSKLSATAPVKDMQQWLEMYLRAERERLMPDYEETYQERVDIAMCVRALLEGESTLGNVKRKLERIFKERDSKDQIVCSTVHKAKGLERDRVWMLDWTFHPERGGEEENIWYVAVTRSGRELYFVEEE